MQRTVESSGMFLVFTRNPQVIALAAAIDGGFASIAPDLQCFEFMMSQGLSLTANTRIEALRTIINVKLIGTSRNPCHPRLFQVQGAGSGQGRAGTVRSRLESM